MKRTFFNIVLIIYFSLLSSNLLSKESIGFTESGQKIILKPDFTWEYFKNDQVSVDEIFYTDENVKITLGNLTSTYPGYNIWISVQSLLKDSYLKIKTHERTGSQDYPRKLIIKDNFGNNLGLKWISPIGNKNIRPYEEEQFSISTKEIPLNSVSYLNLTIPEGVFGNKKKFTFKIPSTRIIRK